MTCDCTESNAYNFRKHKLYRWWIGGQWVLYKNRWYQVDFNGWVYDTSGGYVNKIVCHIDYENSITKIENYRKY